MENYDKYLKDITSKDESSALQAAKALVDSGDLSFFEALIKKTDYMFDFIKANVCKRIEKSTTELNYKNILNFLESYSQDYDETFAVSIAKFASEDLTDEIFELLENGTLSQKCYAAKYFSIIPDTIAAETLQKYAFDEDESLAFNSAEALGKMNDDKSFNEALDFLKKDDNFDKLKAAKFFVAYGHNAPINDIFEAMKTSSMPENISGQIPYIVSLISILKTEHRENAIICIENIIDGLGEILPLSQVFQFELYEILQELINTNRKNNDLQNKIAVVLLKALAKFKTFIENEEYIFDEDKNTKQELNEIFSLLKSQNKDFWNTQKALVKDELTGSKVNIISALSVVREFKIKEASDAVKSLLTQDDEIILCESILTLKYLDKLNEISKNDILSKIKDSNIKAIIENYWR